MARVTVSVAKKTDKVCGRCQRAILKGEKFYWAMPGFRSSWKSRKIRCMDHPFRPSELTTSLRSDALAALEDAEDELSKLDKYSIENEQEILDALQPAIDSIREVAETYGAAAEPFGGGGPNGESKELMEGAADELEGLQLDSFDEEGCEEHEEFNEECDDCKDIKANWAEAQIDAASDAVTSVSV